MTAIISEREYAISFFSGKLITAPPYRAARLNRAPYGVPIVYWGDGENAVRFHHPPNKLSGGQSSRFTENAPAALSSYDPFIFGAVQTEPLDSPLPVNRGFLSFTTAIYGGGETQKILFRQPEI